MQDLWYAIRIAEQAARTATKRMIFRGPRNGSHEFLVPDADHRLAIEQTLDELGIHHFIPVAFEDIKHKKRPKEWKTTRRPLLPGYAFVRTPHDWAALEAAPHVIGVIKAMTGEPIRMPLSDIHSLFYVETIEYLKYRQEREKAMNPRKRRLMEKFKTGSRHKIKHELIGETEVIIRSVASQNTIRVIHDKLGKLTVNVDSFQDAA